MTRNIYLKGKMGKLFGEHWKLNAATVQEAMHGIDVQRGNKLTKYLVDCTEKGIKFHVQRGEELLDYENLTTTLGKEDLIITPIPAGAGISDVFKAIVGIALIITAIFFPPAAGLFGMSVAMTQAAMLGVGALLTMNGMMGLMTPKEPSEAGESHFFDGPVNNVKQGVPVPLLYGRLIVGGSPINFSFLEGDSNLTTKTQYIVTPSGQGNSAANSSAYSTVTNNYGENIDWNTSDTVEEEEA